MANPNTLLPDTLAGEIPGIPTLDESLFSSRPLDLDFGLGDNNALNWTSQIVSDAPSVEVGRHAVEEQLQLYDDDLGLDIPMEDEPTMEEPSISIEAGRDAPPPRSVADDLIGDNSKFHDDDLGLQFGDEEETAPIRDSVEPPPFHDAMDVDATADQTFLLQMPDDEVEARHARGSESPLSSARSSVARELEDEEPTARARQPAAKKRKLLPVDADTEIHNSQIKQQQIDRSAIIRPLNLLPKDPVLLTLMTMQARGEFVSRIMGDGRSKGWAPELRGILSIEVVRKAGALKRKRPQTVEAAEEQESQLGIPQDEIVGGPQNDVGTPLPASDGLMPPQDEEPAVPGQEEDEDIVSPVRENFDDTTMPLVHPEDQGPISQGTQHAVHLLREHFGDSAESSLYQQKKANVLFQDLLPEETTRKADATKMFFELLVLATKDAVKVEQPENQLGGPIRIRAKRSLWGSWAEEKAGGEIATQNDAQPSQPIAV